MIKSRYLRLQMMGICMAGLLMTGCSGDGGEVSTATETPVTEVTETKETGNTVEENEIQDEITEENEIQDEITEDNEIPGNSAEENEAGVVEQEAAKSTKYVEINLSETKEFHAPGDAAAPLELKIISEEDNGVDWAYEWYDEKNLSLPMIGNNWDHFEDENYEYVWMGEELFVYEKETGNCLYELYYPTDKWYVNGNNAYIQDGIFYGASVMNGYATPDTCFLFAYDLEQDKLLWRSADQSYNTMNFIVKGDVILCGYGFTGEKDYLYQINRNTGEIIDKMELKKMPDLLVEQDGKLYVHTYSYNYVIEID